MGPRSFVAPLSGSIAQAFAYIVAGGIVSLLITFAPAVKLQLPEAAFVTNIVGKDRPKAQKGRNPHRARTPSLHGEFAGSQKGAPPSCASYAETTLDKRHSRMELAGPHQTEEPSSPRELHGLYGRAPLLAREDHRGRLL